MIYDFIFTIGLCTILFFVLGMTFFFIRDCVYYPLKFKYFKPDFYFYKLYNKYFGSGNVLCFLSATSEYPYLKFVAVDKKCDIEGLPMQIPINSERIKRLTKEDKINLL